MIRVSSLLLLVLPALALAGDVDADGYEDLAIGVPAENSGEGRIHVLPGSSTGPDDVGEQFFDQGDFSETAEAGDSFASAMAFGDFDGDGYDDIAMGAPGETSGAYVEAGVVHVAYGSNIGVTQFGDQVFTANTPGVPGTADSYAHFGGALIAGNFNGDAYDDLAIASPDEVINLVEGGYVVVLYGSAGGLTTTGAQGFYNWGLGGLAATSAEFGYSLAAADFDSADNGPYDDLVIGCPGCNGDIGGVFVIPGSATGLDDGNTEYWDQDTGLVDGVGANGDSFGWSVAAGDLTGDGLADLVVGAPYDGETGAAAVLHAGVINVIYGGANGLLAGATDEIHSQFDLDGGPRDVGERLGWSLAIGDFDGDEYGDLAVGVPYETDRAGGGQVHVIYGGSGALDLARQDVWHQDDLTSTDEYYDEFGYTLAAGYFNDDSNDVFTDYADLVVGVPGENDNATNAGNVQIILGSSLGLTSASTSHRHQDYGSIDDSQETDDAFGYALSH